MKNRLLASLKRNELYIVSAVIGIVFVAAMAIVAWLLRSSMVTPPYEALKEEDLKKIFVTAFLRFREDDGSPYLKVEFHNGTLWWIKRVEFEFDGSSYTLRDADAFRPLHFGAVRCNLKSPPAASAHIEYDLKVLRAYGYPPAQIKWHAPPGKVAGASNNRTPPN